MTRPHWASQNLPELLPGGPYLKPEVPPMWPPVVLLAMLLTAACQAHPPPPPLVHPRYSTRQGRVSAGWPCPQEGCGCSAWGGAPPCPQEGCGCSAWGGAPNDSDTPPLSESYILNF